MLEPLAWRETAFIERNVDLMAVACPEDNVKVWLEGLLERSRVKFGRHFTTAPSDISRDPNVHIFPAPPTTRLVRIVMAPCVATLLLVPVIICNFIEILSARVVVVILATVCFIAALQSATKTRTVELVVAGAT